MPQVEKRRNGGKCLGGGDESVLKLEVLDTHVENVLNATEMFTSKVMLCW